ncbi:MAG TPA: DUF262 domain-containing protein [Candidatus Binataceae bacterium]|nr:DUF262 domain-containing protein [Candidatus Binataceae bacterium]
MAACDRYGIVGVSRALAIEPARGPAPEHEAGYAYGVVSVAEAVERAVSGEWDVPEFQREFVWRPSQVCALADSLWRGYPIGALLLWRDAKGGGDSRQSRWWIADGQQRLTSLCLLCGREPAWLRRKPARSRALLLQRFAIRFDIGGDGPPRFLVANADAKPHDPRLVPVDRLMAIDPFDPGGQRELRRLATELEASGCGPNADASELYRRLSRVSMIRQRELVATLVQHEHKDVLEIFERLNSRGMRFRRLLLKLLMEELPAAIHWVRRRHTP